MCNVIPVHHLITYGHVMSVFVPVGPSVQSGVDYSDYHVHSDGRSPRWKSPVWSDSGLSGQKTTAIFCSSSHGPPEHHCCLFIVMGDVRGYQVI